MVERVSSFGLNNLMLQSALTTQSRLAEKQMASASGLVTDTYANLSGQAGRIISLEESLARTSTWSSNTQTALDRTNAMYDAVGRIIDELTSLRSSSATADTSGATDYASVGTDALEDLTALMNLQMDGRYLFAGSRSDTAPVDSAALAIPSIPSTPDAGYYRGDSEMMSVRTSEAQVLDYGITADAAGFEKALRAANILAHVDNGSPDQGSLTEAYDLATEALDSLLSVQGRLSLSADRLEGALARQDGYASLLGEMISDIKSVDVAAITVEVSQYETVLQASYSALGKVSGLSLVDYI